MRGRRSTPLVLYAWAPCLIIRLALFEPMLPPIWAVDTRWHAYGGAGLRGGAQGRFQGVKVVAREWLLPWYGCC